MAMYDDLIATVMGDIQADTARARAAALRKEEASQPPEPPPGMPPPGAMPQQPPEMPQMPPPQAQPMSMPQPQPTAPPGPPQQVQATQVPPQPQTAPGGPPGPSAGPMPVLPNALATRQRTPMPAGPPGAATIDPQMAELQRQEDAALQRGQELYARYGEAMKPADRTAMEAAYKARSGEGPAHLIHALAAQQAGKGFEGFQQHYLKQAAAVDEPMKMTGGTMTPTGFVEDPGHAQEMILKKIEAQISANNQIIASNGTRQEKLAAERRNEALERDREAARSADRRMIAGMAAGARNSAADDRKEQHDFTNSTNLSKQYDAITEPYRKELDATSKITSLPTHRPLNAIEMDSVAVLLQKFLDAGSVVREPEFARAEEAMGAIPRIQNYLHKMATGERLNAEVIADIRNLAKIYEEANLGKIKANGDLYSDKARRFGLNPEDVVVSPYYKHKQAGGEGGPAPVRVNSPADVAKLPAGTPFITPDGQRRVSKGPPK